VNSKELERALSQLSTSRPPKSKNTIPKSALTNREAGLWQILLGGLGKSGRKIETTRLESWAIPGVPDVLVCSEAGRFSFWELKAHKGKGKLDLSPHQVSWLSRHAAGPVFVIVRDGALAISVFAGRDAVDLRMDGVAAVEPLAVFEEPYDWVKFFALTAPV
jgi:hypothetical protein